MSSDDLYFECIKRGGHGAAAWPDFARKRFILQHDGKACFEHEMVSDGTERGLYCRICGVHAVTTLA